ncbi:sensor histidine kinase [Paenibacillus sp. KQZ6P-2]|uniref:histidine kinase n=2 Tax=Paenibacillus mangrovi TaxID=2931978 RepID=A0A9X1WZL6_9BACL|nr:sensor histidine kinase [Paenibacillus mangrovi]MCJ8015124.1 sensor histidine kinase [Paenibacillus mangrovi]
MSMPIFYMSQEQGWRRIVGYLMIALFLVTYRQLYFAKKSFSYWLSLQMLLAFFICVAYSPYNLFLGFYTASFIGYYKDQKRFAIALAVFYVMLILPLILNIPRLVRQDVFVVLPFMVVMMMTPFGMRSMFKRQQLERDLNEANERIKELVKREERMRISRDLHDTLGHTLSLITLKSQLVTRLLERDPKKALLEAREIEQTSRAALRQVRELVTGMRTLTVMEELKASERILESAGIQYQAEGDFHLEGISGLIQNIISMCLKEAVTNIVKHSQANACTIAIEQTSGELRLTISDNGIGWNESHEPPVTNGNGLKGMRERLSLIDGTLELSSSSGMTVFIRIPIVIRTTPSDDILTKIEQI